MEEIKTAKQFGYLIGKAIKDNQKDFRVRFNFEKSKNPVIDRLLCLNVILSNEDKINIMAPNGDVLDKIYCRKLFCSMFKDSIVRIPSKMYVWSTYKNSYELKDTPIEVYKDIIRCLNRLAYDKSEKYLIRDMKFSDEISADFKEQYSDEGEYLGEYKYVQSNIKRMDIIIQTKNPKLYALPYMQWVKLNNKWVQIPSKHALAYYAKDAVTFEVVGEKGYKFNSNDADLKCIRYLNNGIAELPESKKLNNNDIDDKPIIESYCKLFNINYDDYSLCELKEALLFNISNIKNDNNYEFINTLLSYNVLVNNLDIIKYHDSKLAEMIKVYIDGLVEQGKMRREDDEVFYEDSMSDDYEDILD